MIKKLLNELSQTKVPDNPGKPSVQIGNFCFLIAATELLLSCPDFVKFIYFYISPRKEPYTQYENQLNSIDLTNICKLYILYYEKNTDLGVLYNAIQTLVLKELGEKERGQEDINVVFLYFEKNILYTLLFSRFQYVTNHDDTYSRKGPYSIYTFINNSSACLSLDSINAIQDSVYGVIILVGNHYEIYCCQNKKIIAMNTSSLLTLPWKTLTFLCQSYLDDCGLTVLKLAEVL